MWVEWVGAGEGNSKGSHHFAGIEIRKCVQFFFGWGRGKGRSLSILTTSPRAPKEKRECPGKIQTGA